MLNWLKSHFATLHQLFLTTVVNDDLGHILSLDNGFEYYIRCIKSACQRSGKLMFIGNGGSAGIASHLAIDYSKNGHVPAITFTDASALTCLSNDYGYEHAFAKQIEFHGRKEDVLIAISSSGRSSNILNAVKSARQIGCKIITFSGFQEKNPLRQLGDINFYVASSEYGFVEVAHVGLGHAALDYMIEEQPKGKQVYKHQKTVLEVIE